MENDTVPCKYCGDPTQMKATKMCDSCWELDSRIRHNIGLATHIMDTIKEEEKNKCKQCGRTMVGMADFCGASCFDAYHNPTIDGL